MYRDRNPSLYLREQYKPHWSSLVLVDPRLRKDSVARAHRAPCPSRFRGSLNISDDVHTLFCYHRNYHFYFSSYFFVHVSEQGLPTFFVLI